MKTKKLYKRKFHPSAYALGENEKFYSDMEAKGWRLVERGLRRSKFEMVTPSRARYRVEVAKIHLLYDGRIPEAQRTVFEDCGWEHVTSRGVLHIFRAPEGSDAPEFYQDPRQQAETLKGVRNRLVLSFLLGLFLIVLLVPTLIALGGGTAAFLSKIQRAWMTVPELPAFWCFMVLSGLSADIIDIWHVSRTYQSLKKGIPLDHEPKGRDLPRLILDNGFRWIAYLCIVLIVFQMATMERGDLPKVPDGPYIVLSDVGWTGERGEFMDNTSHREHTRTFLTEYWNTGEYVKKDDDSGDDGGGWVMFYQDVYLLDDCLDPMDYVESLTEQQTFVKDLDEYTPVEIQGLDAAWVMEEGMEAVAVKGQIIAFINYLDGTYSTERLMDILEALSVRLTAYESGQ